MRDIYALPIVGTEPDRPAVKYRGLDREALSPFDDKGDPYPSIDAEPWLLITAQALIEALGEDLDRVTTLIVTHFDADHWEGLRELAPRFDGPRGGRLTAPIKVYYPGLPDVAAALPGATQALITTARGGAGVRAGERIRAWDAVGATQLFPVREGDIISAGGRLFEVLWPPAALPNQVGDEIGGALEALDTLAEDLAKVGHPALRKNLRTAYDVQPARGFPQAPREGDVPSAYSNDWRVDAEWHLGLDSSCIAAGNAVCPRAHPVQKQWRWRRRWSERLDEGGHASGADVAELVHQIDVNRVGIALIAAALAVIHAAATLVAGTRAAAG